jgi:hypothetical protein
MMRRHISSSALLASHTSTTSNTFIGRHADESNTSSDATKVQSSPNDCQSRSSRKRIVSDLTTSVPTEQGSNSFNTASNDENAPAEQVILSSLRKMMDVERFSRATSDQRAVLVQEDDSSLQNQVWRERVSQWCYDVLDFLEESREVAYVALNILDRYLAVHSTTNKEVAGLGLARHHQPIDQFEYEVIAFTALFLAVRVAGTNRGLQIPELLQLSSSGAQVKHILSAGNTMLQKLSWDHRILTPHIFLRGLMELLVHTCPGISHDRALTLMDFASYLVEISVCDQYFSRMSPSEIAFGALTLSMTCDADFAAGQQASFTLFLQTVREETTIDVESIRLKSILARLLVVYNQSQEAAEASINSISAARCEQNNNGDGDTSYVNNNNGPTTTTTTPHLISTDEEEEDCIVHEFLSNHSLCQDDDDEDDYMDAI